LPADTDQNTSLCRTPPALRSGAPLCLLAPSLVRSAAARVQQACTAGGGTGRKKRPYRWGQAGSRRYDLDTAGTTELSSDPVAAGSNPAGCTTQNPRPTPPQQRIGPGGSPIPAPDSSLCGLRARSPAHTRP